MAKRQGCGLVRGVRDDRNDREDREGALEEKVDVEIRTDIPYRMGERLVTLLPFHYLVTQQCWIGQLDGVEHGTVNIAIKNLDAKTIQSMTDGRQVIIPTFTLEGCYIELQFCIGDPDDAWT